MRPAVDIPLRAPLTTPHAKGELRLPRRLLAVEQVLTMLPETPPHLKQMQRIVSTMRM